MIRKLQNINNWTVFYILVSITVISLAFSARSHLEAGNVNWWSWADGAFQNFSTEMMGAIVTFGLFGLVVDARDKRLAEIKELQKRLIREAGAESNDHAKAAIDWIRAEGWLTVDDDIQLLKGAYLRKAKLQDVKLYRANLNGVNLMDADLQFVYLDEANLSSANLRFANLRGAILNNVNLRDADLTGANLEGTDLTGANLQGVQLDRIKIDGQTIPPLPNRDYLGEDEDGNSMYLSGWTPETDMSRYTDPNHPDFWQPDWVKEQKD